MKHCIVVQDLSCFGKCSLSIALPVLSSAGIQTSVLPTALLSTHTGGLGTPYVRDLEQDMHAIRQHWSTQSFPVDAIYSGYVSSTKQLREIQALTDQYANSFFMVDPVMGDHGRLYASLPSNIQEEMRLLCKHADLIAPNMTEVYALLNEPWQSGPYTEQEITRILSKLREFTKAQIVLTGVCLDQHSIGCAVWSGNQELTFHMKERVAQDFHGTGDLFASSLLGAYLQGHTLEQSVEIAMNFTVESMKLSIASKCDERYGVQFEPLLDTYIQWCKERNMI